MRSGEGPVAIRLAHGARAVEALLASEVRERVAAGERDPRLLRHPVRIVVPSKSLRAHVAAVLMREFGRAVAGVRVQTLHGLAVEVVERGGGSGGASDLLFPILVRQQAREEPALRDALDGLVDGYRVVAEDVADLLDAGFQGEHQGACGDALAELAAMPDVAARARALLRVAARSSDAMDARGVGHRVRLIGEACALLERDAEAVLPCRALLIHGFAEATGLRADLLEILVRHRSAQIYLDEPPDPSPALRGATPMWRFSQRLRRRLEGLAPVEESREPASKQPAPAVFEAPGGHAEVRAVADRVRLRLDAGQDPEAIAVVCRDVERYRVAIRQHFRRLGIPFSGVGEKGSTGATRRRVQALLDLLRQGGRTPADRWLEATARLDSVSPSDSHADLRLALRHIGAVRVADVAAQPPRRRDLSLPAVGAWKDGEEEGEVARASRRMLSLDAFARGVAAARRVCRQLDRIGTARCLGARLDELRRLLCEGLGWEAQAPECRPVLDAVEALTRALPADFSLTDDDFQLLLRRAFDPLGAEPIGGAGGGVQVLSVMEARARTFGDLFVIGLNRGVFPRRVRPDPLLPDLVRRKLAEVLPDLPIKATSIEEDRYLFAQLLSSSPRVTLSWQTATDDGVDCARSTLVERLRWGSEGFEPLGVPPLCPRPTADGPRAGRQTPAEAAQRAGLYAPARAGFAEALALACEDVDRSLPGGLRVGRADAATRGRLRVLDEFDPPRPRPAGLGPYFGFTGAVAEAGDPRTGPLYITNVEALARCPWQSFLSRLLRLFPPPDPLAALPGSDPRLLGLVVHRALEDIAQVALGDPPSSLDDARLRAPVRIVWPQGDALEKLLRRAASHVLTEDGIAMNGLARILADQARPFVERARELDAGDDAAGGVVAAELKGSIPWADGRTLSFRADRVDLSDGNLVLTDYKTGRPISTGVNASTREKHLLAAVSRGESLQAAIYAVAAGGDGEGRFVFLRPGLIPDHAEYAVRSDREDVLAPFRAAVESALRAIDAGAFVPRLTGEDLQTENPDCERCELATACIRGDSGFRMRLTRWLEADGADRGGDAERALRAIWNLRAQKRAESKPVESP